MEPNPTYPAGADDVTNETTNKTIFETAADEEDDAPQYDRPSKSQLKRDSTALQDMGAELIKLSPERLNKIEMPDNLRTALRDAQRITQNGAIRRQRQYIGKLMRNVDVEPLKAALDEVKGISAAAKAEQQKLERLRTQLMESEEPLGDIARRHPGADIQHLRQLRRNALKEQQLNKPPRAYRELFRVLRDLEFQGVADNGATDEPDEAS